jgi:hypothetical protein
MNFNGIWFIWYYTAIKGEGRGEGDKLTNRPLFLAYLLGRLLLIA